MTNIPLRQTQQIIPSTTLLERRHPEPVGTAVIGRARRAADGVADDLLARSGGLQLGLST